VGPPTELRSAFEDEILLQKARSSLRLGEDARLVRDRRKPDLGHELEETWHRRQEPMGRPIGAKALAFGRHEQRDGTEKRGAPRSTAR
jgi:hypothetical protein